VDGRSAEPSPWARPAVCVGGCDTARASDFEEVGLLFELQMSIPVEAVEPGSAVGGAGAVFPGVDEKACATDLATKIPLVESALTVENMQLNRTARALLKFSNTTGERVFLFPLKDGEAPPGPCAPCIWLEDSEKVSIALLRAELDMPKIRVVFVSLTPCTTPASFPPRWSYSRQLTARSGRSLER
jgi:hypothetical protein